MGSGTFAHDVLTGDPFGSLRRKEKKATDDALAEQERLNQEILDAEKEKVKGEEKVVANTEARKRQRQRSRGASGRSGTILTSPLGAVGELDQPRNTILGG